MGTAEKEETESCSDRTQQSAVEGVEAQVALCRGATASGRHGHVVAEAHRSLQPRWQAEASRG